MASELEPIVGDWYTYRGKKFTVIDVDEDEGLVEIQYASGTVQQVDLNAWYDMDLEQSEEPEDWNTDIEDEVIESDGSPRSSRWENQDEDKDEDEDEDEGEDEDEDEDDDDDDDWEEDEEEAELEDEWRDRRSDEDDSYDEH